MACPYFEPLAPRNRTPQPETALLPLGDAWDGVCRAQAAGPVAPAAALVHRCCNLGYARLECRNFPSDADADAVRFAIAGDDGESIAILYVVERDHLPGAHGEICWSRGAHAFAALPAIPLLASQAEAYVGSYLRRKNQNA